MNAIGLHPRGRTSPRRSPEFVEDHTQQMPNLVIPQTKSAEIKLFLDGDVKQHNISMF